MEEPIPTSQVPHPEEFVADISSCSNDCSCGSDREPNNVSMPICFLVREQAKSLVAIQDLQSRMNHVESVQVDVIDTLMQFRNFLCESANSASDLSPNYLNTTNCSNDTSSASKLNTTTYHSTYEPLRSILKPTSYSTKINESVCNEFQRTSSIVTIQDQPQKHFYSAKSKDSALESDKQDSGLDSDCREHNEGHPSIKNAPNWINPDANDQLLQLLDEISYRSEYLQKQLAVVEESSDMKEETISAPDISKTQTDNFSRKNSCCEVNVNVLESSSNSSGCKKAQQKYSSSDDSHEIDSPKLPATTQYNNSAYGFIEKKSFCDKSSSTRKRVGNNIDSTLVSSILKESNVVDLQRQALIYLVDNAVLNTKLREVEQALSCKHVESDKVENSLKEEARLLMMENRELRICLDEQKMEANTLKARVVMLERVLQSITVENQELNWQLGESLNLQPFSKKVPHNIPSSFSYGSSTNSRPVRKSSSLPSQSFRNYNVSCGKSKFPSNSSSFLDVTVEEPDDYTSGQDQPVKATLKCRNGPIQSSTPFQRSKGRAVDSLNVGIPTSFQSLKKCLKSNHSFDSENTSFKSAKSERYPGDCENIPQSCVRNRPLPRSSSHETFALPMGNVSKFPFNSILEKLKANSEFRLSKSVPTNKDGETSVSAYDQEVESSSNASTMQEQHRSQERESKSSQGNSSRNTSQSKKGRNIHQRIQNILDRIVAESEEAA